ncbi:patatin-like phospholipase family protein [Denitromonas ohlonensis]|uniref:BamA/TamA family outer membrane protein n=2 Tax=Denitromonas TaxID=139331 RepID=A0A557RPP8_9RHOO|nr:patatin-like phospholipase family protein [Denitromonas ohlonensis]TVO67075.1 BamA/TamA family outer membrane protein [Denitromonas ohlonensis]TVO79135.1 BamA/TamA family outer membrane protein [Denitromonas ohlonensis]
MFHRLFGLLMLGAVLASPASGGQGGVALVLSGGGARGVAHIGVLKVMEQMRIPVDCVVGTSMGAIVAAAYAAGVPLDEMERQVRAADWDAIFANTVARDQQPFREKQDASRNRSAVSLGYGNGRVLLPHSAIAGQELDRFLQRLIGSADALTNFDSLALPFRAMATDLETGGLVVLDDGPLWRAMRASMAVPGVFLPIEREGRLLVDGGLVLNLPVDQGRRLCGSRVIAVNLGTPPMARDRLQSATDIVLQAINLALEQNVAQQLAQLGPDDALVQVDLGTITSMDFDRVLDTLPLGEAAARRAATDLARFSVDAESFAAWQRQRELRWRVPEPVIREVVVDGLRYVSPDAMAARLRGLKGEPLDRVALETQIDDLYSGGDFERLRYSLVRDGAVADLRIEAAEKSWGPTFLRFGGGLSADFEGDGAVGLYAGVSRRWLNRWGARLDADIQLGTTNRFRSELYQPLGRNAAWFVAPSIELQTRALPVYNDGNKLADYKVRERTLGLDLGYEVGAWGELRMGLRRGTQRAEVLAGQALYPAVDLHTGWLEASATLDRLDSPFFPRRGYAARLRVARHHERFGSDQDYTLTALNGSAAMSYREHSAQFGVLVSGSPDRDLPAVARTLLGGPFLLSGYRYGELTADQVFLLRGAYYRRISKLPDSLGRGVYMGATYEWASLRAYASADADAGVYRSLSLFVGADTVLGPLYLGAGVSPEVNEVRFFLQFGQPY